MAEPVRVISALQSLEKLADQITAVFPDFPGESFLRTALQDRPTIELGSGLSIDLMSCHPTLQQTPPASFPAQVAS